MPHFIPTREPWLMLAYLTAGLLAVIVFGWTLTFIGPLLSNGQLVDADSYTWLGHVQRLLDTGNWYDRLQPRANWPFGETQHSTRPLDGILLIATVVLTPFMGREAALFWAGAAISPLLYLGLGVAVAWTAASLFGRWRGPVAIVVLLAQFAALAYSLPGRADHHTLIMLCFTLALRAASLALREPGNSRHAVLAGALAGLGVWLSPEFLLFLAVAFAALTLAWIRSGEQARSSTGLLFATALCITIAVALLLEYPLAEILEPRYDRISIADLVIALLAATFWLAVGFAGKRDMGHKGLRNRLITSASGAALALGGFALLFPGFLAGPLAGIDERARIVLVDIVMETRGLLPTDAQGLQSLVLYLGSALLALPVAIAGLRREWDGPLAPVWTMLGLCVAIYLGTTLFMLRFAPYAEIAGAIVLSDLLVRLASGTRTTTRFAAVVAGAAVLGGIGVSAYVAGRSLERLPPCHASLPDLAAFIDRDAVGAENPWTIVAFADLGPELLYRTKHRVIATPSLSNQDGAIAMFSILNATDDRTTRSTIETRGVDHVIICQALPFSAPLAGDARLIARLYRGEPPTWLEQMPLPAAIEGTYDLYRVRNDGN